MDTIRSEIGLKLLNKGVLISEIDVLAHVLPMEYIAKTSEGGYEYVWSQKAVMCPWEVVFTGEEMRGSKVELPRKREGKEEFEVGMRVVSVSQSAYGVSGVVAGYRDDGSVVMNELVHPPAHLPANCRVTHGEQRFYTARELSRALSVSQRTVKRFLGSFKVKHSSEGLVGMFGLGLDLYNSADWLHVEGWSQWEDRLNEYTYSPDVLEELKVYKSRFPHLWSKIEELQCAKIVRVELIFPDLTEPINELRRISLFLTKLPSSKIPWTPDLSSRLPANDILRISDFLLHTSEVPSHSPISVNPSTLIPCEKQPIRPIFTGKFRFNLGDIVVNITNKSVPYVDFGKIGVVVGLYRHGYVEIVCRAERNREKVVGKVVRMEDLVNVQEKVVVTLRKKGSGGKGKGKNWVAKAAAQQKQEKEESLSLKEFPVFNPDAAEFTPLSTPTDVTAPESGSLPPPSL